MDSLVSTEWLAAELGANDLCVVDATWVMDGQGDPAADFRAAHIPGAVFLDLERVRDTTTPLPMMLPSADFLLQGLAAIGIGDGCRILLYDNSPYHTAARAWFMLRSFGLQNVAILDGGLGKWRAEGRPIASGDAVADERPLTVHLDRALVRDRDQMLANLESGIEQVVDARSATRFAGEEPDLRPGLAAGHIPASRNLPMGRLFHADGTYKSSDAIRAEFEAAGIDPDRPVTTTCGSGVTASALAFALHLLGQRAAVYDASWTEWGADPSTPKETGAV